MTFACYRGSGFKVLNFAISLGIEACQLFYEYANMSRHFLGICHFSCSQTACYILLSKSSLNREQNRSANQN